MQSTDLLYASFYQRQIVMPEIGHEGQIRLGRSRVLVIGAGGLGSAVLFALAGAGIGRIGIMDVDRVSASNLNRQFLYTSADIGMLKAEQAQKRLLDYHPDLKVDAFPETLTPGLAAERFGDHDLIIGAVDNNRTRRVINAACCGLGQTWVDGGVSGFSGYVAQIVPGQTPCFDCLFGYAGLPLDNQTSKSGTILTNDLGQADPMRPLPAYSGVIGASASVIGSLEATLAILYLLGLPNPLRDEILYYHGRQMTTSRIHIERTPDCPVCGELF